MSQASYPFDATGQAVTNFVENEYHTLTEVNSAPYRILIPDFAPFYTHNLLVEHVDLQGNTTPLDEGVDFYLCLPYFDAQRVTGKSVYGGIAVINSFADGGVRISYQTVGGPWCADIPYVYLRLSEAVYNPRMTWWDKLTNVQDNFPPLEHDHSLDDVEQAMVINTTLVGIRDAILQGNQNVPGEFVAHMLNHAIHPTSLTALGATAIASLPMATDQEVLNAEPLDKAITLRQVVLLFNALNN